MTPAAHWHRRHEVAKQQAREPDDWLGTATAYALRGVVFLLIGYVAASG